jgi:hypothetical protein
MSDFILESFLKVIESIHHFSTANHLPRNLVLKNTMGVKELHIAIGVFAYFTNREEVT